ncbi:hypothetical protein ABID16_000137 [Rhizobium aquaticum]|uniref:ABC transporter substrate-binding protein n=1 Tax=Rhizobium aquaticum TaxID=1549636 RepID=A0ABV2ITN0_9HYPH
MSPEERQLLNELFARVGQAASTPRDPDAETMIRDELARHPYAAYYLAQAVILQEKGLEASAARIGQLEQQVKDLQQGATAQQGQQGQQGGFLSGLSSLFGGNGQGQGAQQPQPGPWGRSGPQAPAYDGGYTRGAPQPGPWSQPAQPPYAAPQQPSRGGGFLAGAMTTAAGVAGGMLMADAVRSLFAPHFGNGGLFGAGGVAGAPVVEETVVNNFFGNGNQTDPSNNWQNGNDSEQSALADMSNATQNTDGGNDDDYDTSSYDDGGFDDSNYA